MTSDVKQFDPERMMDHMYWWGVPTLFACTHDPDPANCDIALVGVPHSTGNGTTERDQHLGPRAVRHVSSGNRRVHMGFGMSPWEACRINDVGDVPFPEANDNEACIERISAFFTQLGNAGTRPVAIGGDHSITGGIVQAIGGEGSALTGGKKAALLHLDAHTDAFDNLDPLVGREEVGRPLGELPGGARQRRSGQIGTDRHARQPAHPRLAPAQLRSRLRSDHHGAVPARSASMPPSR